MRKTFSAFACLFAASLLMGAATTPAPANAKVKVTGAIRAGVMAVGAETTGIEIIEGGSAYELDIKDAAMKKKAEDLNGKQATVSGTLTVKVSPEKGQRRVIAVESLEAAKP